MEEQIAHGRVKQENIVIHLEDPYENMKSRMVNGD